LGLPFFWRSLTPPIRDEHGKVPPDNIAKLERVIIGGVPQWVLMRGYSTRNPLILFLHGGPGMPSMYLAHAFQRSLEKNFVIIHWDRRGAGKSYSEGIPPETVRVSQEIADTRELVNLLRAKFGQSRILLIGHSYGSYLGMIVLQRFPELFYAYIGIGQLAYSDERNSDAQDEWLKAKAKETNNRQLLEQLETGVPIDREKWLFRFGGELHRKKSFTSLLWIGLLAPEYSIMDVLRVRKGVSFTHKNLKYDMIDGNLIDTVGRVDVPVYFFSGRYDYTDPFEFSQEYLNRLQAPRKEMVWFEESAHFPFLEEPNRFASEVRRVSTETAP
jgi:pimeloyl-ACP methyl ester carboxylesterase